MKLISVEYMAQHWTLKLYTTCCQKSDHTLPLSQHDAGGGAFLRFFRETDLLRLVRRFLQSNVTHAPLSALLGEGRFLVIGLAYLCC